MIEKYLYLIYNRRKIFLEGILNLKEMKIVDGVNHIDEVKNLIIDYTKFLGCDLTFQNLDEELSTVFFARR